MCSFETREDILIESSIDYVESYSGLKSHKYEIYRGRAQMIRHVIAIKFKPRTSSKQVRALMDSMRRIQVEGMLSLECGRDSGLRNGNWDFAVTADFVDQEAYIRFDRDPEHDRIRRGIASEVIESAAGAQIEIPRRQQHVADVGRTPRRMKIRRHRLTNLDATDVPRESLADILVVAQITPCEPSVRSSAISPSPA